MRGILQPRASHACSASKLACKPHVCKHSPRYTVTSVCCCHHKLLLCFIHQMAHELLCLLILVSISRYLIPIHIAQHIGQVCFVLGSLYVPACVLCRLSNCRAWRQGLHGRPGRLWVALKPIPPGQRHLAFHNTAGLCVPACTHKLPNSHCRALFLDVLMQCSTTSEMFGYALLLLSICFTMSLPGHFMRRYFALQGFVGRQTYDWYV